MTLDLTRVVGQISSMVATIDPAVQSRRYNALDDAWRSLDSVDVNIRLRAPAKTSFLLARVEGEYRERFPLPALPTSYTIAATDGSMILPDRHSPARFYLMNIGKVFLRYGDQPTARFSAEPDLRFEERDLFVTSGSRRVPVNETILGLRRAAAELRAGAELLADLDTPGLVLLDGTLILWSLEANDRGIATEILREFTDALDTFQRAGLPIASYVSSPGSSDLMNTLRVSVCDYPAMGRPVNCDDCFGRIVDEGHTPACDILPTVPDRLLLERIANLQPGERTVVYESQSRILELYGPDHHIGFFYVNTGQEIGRIEIPAWVAREPRMLDLIHSVVYDQCQLGRGYPVALQEAHEMAVLSMTDRRLVEAAIERQLAEHGAVRMRTGKDASKRGRFV